MIHFSCPKCGTKYEIEDDLAGVNAVCEECNTKLTIPHEDDMVARIAGNEMESEAQGEVESVPSQDKFVIDFEADSKIEHPQPPVQTTFPSAKMSPRQRRLMADWRSLQEHFSSFHLIQLKSYVGNPPEEYIIVYKVKGIERVDGQNIVYRNYHEVEIKLPGTYPRTPPLCRVLTPVFHPNIEPAVICIGDHWTAAERLCDLIVRIGEMITYQAHNVKSPLDGEAAMWTDLHMDMLPIDNSDLTPPGM